MVQEKDLIKEAQAGSNEAKNILYDNYKYIIDIIMHKYYNASLKYKVDLKELESEASYALTEALTNYKEDMNTKLATFISLCVDRRCQKVLKSYRTKKAQAINSAYSLDYDYEEGFTLKDIIVDVSKDPLNDLTSQENYRELLTKIKEKLSDFEYEVFSYLINGFDYLTIALILKKNSKQIDNTIQRIKHKIKDILRD